MVEDEDGNDFDALYSHYLKEIYTPVRGIGMTDMSYFDLKVGLKGAIKSQNMFMLSYVTLISGIYDAYPLIQSKIIFSEFKFS